MSTRDVTSQTSPEVRKDEKRVRARLPTGYRTRDGNRAFRDQTVVDIYVSENPTAPEKENRRVRKQLVHPGGQLHAERKGALTESPSLPPKAHIIPGCRGQQDIMEPTLVVTCRHEVAYPIRDVLHVRQRERLVW